MPDYNPYPASRSLTDDVKHADEPQRPPAADPAGSNEAIALIRAKLDRIYADAPDPFAEEKKAVAAPKRSKHQQYMYDLNASGRSLAEIQTAWHDYYAALPDDEKHEVWREYYRANPAAKPQEAEAVKSKPVTLPRPELIHKPVLSQSYVHPKFDYTPLARQPKYEENVPEISRTLPQSPRQPAKKKAVAEARSAISAKLAAGRQLHAKDHLHSLFFGLAVGTITLVIFLFGFFNEMFLAPFIQPSRSVGATPIIINPNDIAATDKPEVIIPKIHLEIPVDYTQTSTNEATIETALENGVVHYPSTVMPGQAGNTAFFGHSSNNIFNPGKYKFAFVLLHELEAGDTFYLTYNGKVYVYKVFQKQIVEPADVGVLGNIPGHAATATLITCDPPGTSLHRLVVAGDQISPDPAGQPGGTNSSPTTPTNSNELPGNGPSLLNRIWSAIF